MLCVPVSNEALHEAVPVERATLVQPGIAAPPSRKVTLPVGVPALPLTLAVNVTVLPAGAGVRELESPTPAEAVLTDWLIAPDVAAV